MENFANIISNDCTSGFLYQYYGVPYQNPFMWGIFSIKNFIYLMEHYDDINFSNREYEEHQALGQWWFTPSLRIDNKLTYDFIHYMRCKDIETCTKTTFETLSSKFPYANMLLYKDMDKYLFEKYDKRIFRMTKSPVFVYHQNNAFDKDEEIISLLKSTSKYPLLLFTQDVRFDKLYSPNRLIVHCGNSTPEICANHIKNNCSHILEMSK